MSDFEDVADDDASIAPATDALEAISALASKQMELEDLVANIQERLDGAKRALLVVSQFQLPEAMAAVGMEKFVLTNGAEITSKGFVTGSISDDHRVEAYQWLRDNNHDSIIKNEIKARVERGHDEDAATVEEFLREHGIDYDRKESIHGNTLNAFLREEIEGGSDIPHDVFGVFVGAKAKITRPI